MRSIAFLHAFGISITLLAPLTGWTATPVAYTQPAYESPVRGDPDDLLLIPGHGLAAGDVVVYQSVADTTHLPVHPAGAPTASDATQGVADLVSAAGAPHSLVVHLPAAMTAEQSYVFWILAPDGTWSSPILLNDARPLWITPDSAYSSASLAGLPRVLKVIGRNLQPAPAADASTQVRLVGATTGTTYLLTAKNTNSDSVNTTAALERYVAEVNLPPTLVVDQYSVQLSRDGTSWVPLLGNGRAAAQTFTVNADPEVPTMFMVSDPQFADPVTGPCHPDDGIDDTACIILAIRAAAQAGGGTVVFGPGVWTLSNPGTWPSGVSYSNRLGTQAGPCSAAPQTCGVSYYGVLVPLNVNLLGTGPATTTIERTTSWLIAGAGLADFTLQGNNTVSGIGFVDDIDYTGGFAGAAEIQLGLRWYFAHLYNKNDPVTVSNVVLTNNAFVHPYFAIANGGLPTDHVYITNNTFGGAWNTAILLQQDRNDAHNLVTPVYPYTPYRLNDSVIAYNTFYPSSWQQTAATYTSGGTIATQIDTSLHLDFSHNVADGTVTQYLVNPATDPRGWRAAHFWSTGANQEMMLVSNNIVTCSGDKYGDGEAIVFDGSAVLGGMPGYQPVIAAAAWTDPNGIAGTQLSVQGTVVTTIPNSSGPIDISANPGALYKDYWVQVVQGTGKGQWRKVTALTTGSNSAGPTVTLNVTPAFDVLPDSTSEVTLDFAFWQQVTVNNFVDQRTPACTKANTRGGGVGGALMWYASTADSAMEGNQQYDTTGIFMRHVYQPPQPPVGVSDHVGLALQSMNEVRDNLIQGSYNPANTGGTPGGLWLAYGATKSYCSAGVCTSAMPPSDLGFGLRVAHNTLIQAEARDVDGTVHPPIGAIGVNADWSTGPLDPSGASNWQMGDATLIFNNSLAQTHVGIGVDVAQGTTLHSVNNWRTTLYGNSCANGVVPVSDLGLGTVRYCPANAAGNCECAVAASVDVGVSASRAVSGNSVQYTVSVSNHSTTAASGVTLTLESSAGALLDPGSIVTTLGSCNPAINVCSLGSLAGGQSATVTVTGTVASSSPDPVTFAVAHQEPDPVPGNDSTSI